MIKTSIYVIILGSLFFLAQCSRVVVAPNSKDVSIENSPTSLEDLDYQVYMAIIRKSHGSFAVGDQTDPDHQFERVSGLLDGKNEDILESFRVRNGMTVRLERKFDTDREYRLIDSLELNEPVLSKGKESPLKSFGSYYVFSGVGYSRDQKLAVVHADYYCPLCGEGGYYLLSNENGQWEVIKDAIGWQS